MSAGTITLTNNSATVTGSGTTFTDLEPGDFIVATVGGITYTLPVSTVDSATKITLTSAYTGPTQSGLAWDAVPRATQNQVTAELVAQATQALRVLNKDKINWQQVFSAGGNITVTLPDGSSFTGPSWFYLANQLGLINTSLTGKANIADVLTKADNLASVASKPEARTNLGLGGAAVLNVGNTANTVAAGDDKRLNSVDGKTGGVVNGALFTLGDGQIVRSKKKADGSWPTTTPAHAVLLDGRVANAGQPGGWFGMNMTENVGVDCYGALYLQAAGVDKSWLFAQSGNAISPGSWIPNSDARLKKDKVRVENPLAKMRQIGGYTWTRLDSGAWGIGFLSQEVGAVFPKAVSIGPDRALPDGTIVEGVQSPDSYGVSAALHHESILQLMDIVKEAITTIAGVTTDESAKAALKALAERIPAPDTQ